VGGDAGNPTNAAEVLKSDDSSVTWLNLVCLVHGEGAELPNNNQRSMQNLVQLFSYRESA